MGRFPRTFHARGVRRQEDSILLLSEKEAGPTRLSERAPSLPHRWRQSPKRVSVGGEGLSIKTHGFLY